MSAENMTWDSSESGSGAYVGRAEFEALERRLLKAEQTIRTQESQIKMLLTQRLSTPIGTVAPTTSLFPERSRSPFDRIVPRAKPGVPTRLAPVEDHTKLATAVDEFALNNGLDPKCHEALTSQPPEVQQHVIQQGPAEGRNPSAMVMGRIAKSSTLIGRGGPVDLTGYGLSSSAIGSGGFMNGGELSDGFGVTESVEEFILNNSLDESCSETLRNQTFDCQSAVISQGPAEGRNPSAMIMGRIAKYMRGH